MAKRLRSNREQFADDDIDFVEFPGVGHEVGGDQVLLTEKVVPTVQAWITRRLGTAW